MLRPISTAQTRPWCNTEVVTEQLARLKADREAERQRDASPLDDDDYPRECYVCGEYPQPRSLYCSSLCEAIMEGGDDDFRHIEGRKLT